ncbi:hypothetical protein GOV11_03360 [Candidatus Woesearchaeota archaeon]|nr:hypothetical protein [Candidatus Woesearchaeota archaeon]
MTKFRTFMSYGFRKTFRKTAGMEKIWLKNVILGSQNNPTGKPLRTPSLRERRFKGKRSHFVVDNETRRIMFVAYGHKREQDETISHILNNLEEFIGDLRRQ